MISYTNIRWLVLSTEIRIFLAVAQQGGETDAWTVRLAARTSYRVAATFDLGAFAARQGKTVGTRQWIKVPVRAGWSTARSRPSSSAPTRNSIKTEFQRANQKRLLSDWLCPHYRATSCPRAVPRRLTGDRPALMPPMLP